MKILGDIELYGALLQLFCEMLILQRSRKAEATIERARQFRSMYGRASEAIQTDRTLGWWLGASKKKSDRLLALAAFARGLKRMSSLLRVGGVSRREPAVERRFAANFARVAHAVELVDVRKSDAREHGDCAVLDACRRIEHLMEDEGPPIAASNDGLVDPATTIVEHALWLFEHRKDDLVAEIVRLRDTAFFPIYLPRCEPRG